MNGKPEFYEYFAEATPALVSPTLEPFGKRMEGYWGACVPLQVLTFTGMRIRYLIPREETLKTGEHVVGRLLSEKGLFERAVADFGAASAILKGIFREIEAEDLESASSAKLFLLERRLNDAYTACYVPGYLMEPAYSYLEHAVRERLTEILRRKGREKEYSRFFVDLTPIAGEPFHAAEDKDLLEILEVIQKDERALGLFEDSEERFAARLAEFPQIETRLKGHAERFFWMNNSYAAVTKLDDKYFIAQLKEKLAARTDAKAALREYGEKERKRRAAREKALEELDVPKDFRELLALVGKVAYFQDYRKTSMLQAVHYSSKLIARLAELYKIPLADLLYALPRELDEKRLQSRDFAKELHLRKRRCLIVYGYDDWQIFYGEQAAAKEKQVLGEREEKVDASANVMGTCASTGYAVGRAAIVLATADIGKVKKGAVLVARSTRPDMVPAMKKACAIVTDEGGITSHAAIVSRELGIPCIIGTKIATRVFEEGDLLEVRADHGVVRKVQG